MASSAESKKTCFSAKDFETKNDVRWCPGCGDYAVLKAAQKALASLGSLPHQTVFVSGIGCSSRFPYYLNTYGFHSIHGRAPSVATGLKLANPELDVWVVTGDGDGLSIGVGHLIHTLRRNVDLNILLFNNQIYGLTKGQYSPTSEVGKVTKSTPFGSLDAPLDPLKLALSVGASFVARTTDVDIKHMEKTFIEASKHRGTSFVEIFQNCVIFNDNAFESVTARENRVKNQLHLRPGEPLCFGEKNKYGICFDGITPRVIDTDDSKEKVSVFDPSSEIMAQALAQFSLPDFPIPLGVIYQSNRPTFNDSVKALEAERVSSLPSDKADLTSLFMGNNYWQVSE